MFDYLQGEVVELMPTYAVIDVNGIGYYVNISLTTYEQIQNKKTVKIYVHQILREDAIMLFGFATKEEREIFRLLISVSGVGAITARLMLSSLKPEEIRNAIINADADLIKSVKGIGLKTAQRIIVDLKDKISEKETKVILAQADTVRQDAIDALVALGFTRKSVEKVVNKLLKQNPNYNLEELIKSSFKYLT